jgi:uncharacterized phage-associated protein
MNDPRAVANFMLEVATGKGVGITNLSLQKLLFFAHSISLVERKRKLVSGYFEAWQYGPVHPAVYHAFKEAGSSVISFRALAVDPVTRMRRPVEPLDEPQARELCERVILQFGRLSAGRLVDITHAEGGPWHHVVCASKTGANIGLRISDDVIAKLHGRQKVTVTPVPRVGEPLEDKPYET